MKDQRWRDLLKQCGYEWDGASDFEAIIRALKLANEQGWDACWNSVVERATELEDE